MKRIFYRVVASLLVLGGVGACTQESVQPEPEFFVKANRDGAAWLVPGSGAYDKAQDEFYVIGAQSDGSATQAYLRLGFNVPPEQPLAAVVQTPTTLSLIPATWTALLGGDVIVDSYTAVNNSPDTHLQITKIDTIQKVVEGTFDAALRRDARWSQQGEMIRFTEGSFRVHYQ